MGSYKFGNSFIKGIVLFYLAKKDLTDMRVACMKARHKRKRVINATPTSTWTLPITQISMIFNPSVPHINNELLHP